MLAIYIPKTWIFWGVIKKASLMCAPNSSISHQSKQVDIR